MSKPDLRRRRTRDDLDGHVMVGPDPGHDGASPDALAVERWQGSVGNHLVAEALSGAPIEGLGGLVHDQLAMGVAGVATAAPGLAATRRLLRRAADPGASELAAIRGGGGQPLEPAVRARMEQAFGHDFSHVRVHADGPAARAAEALGAHAFAIGADIWFGGGEFAPGTPRGDRLLAHELTHVVQHDEGRLPSPSGDGLEVSSPSDPAEQEAYANESRIVGALGVLDAQAAGPVPEGGGEAGGPVEASPAGPVLLQDAPEQAGPEPAAAEQEVPDELDRATAAIARAWPMPTTRDGVIAAAREWDAMLRDDRTRGPRYRAAIAQRCVDAFRELERLMAQDLDGLGEVEGDDPLAGNPAGIPPFGRVDEWATIAASAPADEPEAPQRRRRPAPSGDRGEAETPPAPNMDDFDLGTPRAPDTEVTQRQTDREEALNEAARDVTALDGAIGVGGAVADLAGLASVSFFAGLAGLATHTASFVISLLQASEAWRRGAQMGGLRIATIGLDVVARRGPYHDAAVPGELLLSAGRPHGQSIVDAVYGGASDRRRAELDQNMLVAASHLGLRVASDMGERTAAFRRVAGERGVDPRLVEQEIPKLRQEFMRRIHPVIAARVQAAYRAMYGP